MKRYVATVHVEVSADSPEARDFLLTALVKRLNSCGAGVMFPDVGAATLRKVSVSRVRPKRPKP